MSILRTSILPVSRKVLATRALTTSAVRSKTITESVKDAADSVSRVPRHTTRKQLVKEAELTCFRD